MMFGLSDDVIEKIQNAFAENAKVDKAIVFGSRAKGNYKEGSDIDIAIKGQDLNFDDTLSLHQKFDELNIPYKIDLINYHTIKEPDLKDHIDRVGIELYSRWKEVKLGDVVKINQKTIDKTYKNSLIEYLDTGSIKQNKIEGFQKFNLVDAPSRAKRLVKKNDIIYSTVRPIQRHYGFIEDTIENLVVSTGFAVISTIKEKANAKYLFYLLSSDDIVNYLDSIADGSTSAYPSLRPDDLAVLDVFLPPLSEQTSIASILSSLDDKIDLLHRQNKTLEQLAETLFRSYFPMTNEDNKYVELGNYVECINGVSYKSSELNPSKVGMVSLKSFDRNGGFSIDGFKEFTGKFKEKQEVVEGDLIVAHTDITQDAEVIGNPALVISNPNFETMTISMDIVKVISKVDWVSIEFLYFLMRTREFKSHCEGCANGSTVLHLNKQAIPTFEFPEPDKNNVADFTKQAREIVSKIFLNHRQLRNLVKTRDTLLPKLMSGEIRVKI